MKSRLLLLTLVFWSVCGHPAWADKPITPVKVYVLAVGCCVPWLKATFCKSTTQEFVDVLVSRMGIPQKNVSTVFDQDATYQGMVDGFKWLEEKTIEQDTAVVFYLGHGRQLEDLEGEESDGLDEVLWLWSEKMPKSQWYAVNNRIWMKDDDFSALVGRIPASRKLIIVDTCQMGTVLEPMPSFKDEKRIAVITGADDGVDSKMIPERKDSVFVRSLIQAVERGASNLREAFDVAKEQTIRETEAICKERRLKSPEKPCKGQIPQISDPHGITENLRFKY